MITALDEIFFNEYVSSASWDGDGQVCDLESRPFFRYCSTGRQRFGIGRVPPFVVRDLNDRELATFTCRSRFPRGVFDITRRGARIGQVLQRTILFTEYAADFDNGTRIHFRFPLFTALFHGQSDSGATLQIRMWAHRTWVARVDSRINTPLLAAVVAFLHRERLRHG